MKRYFQLGSNCGIDNHNQTSVTKRGSKTSEMSFPMPRTRLPVMWLQEFFDKKIARTVEFSRTILVAFYWNKNICRLTTGFPYKGTVCKVFCGR